MNTVLLTNMTDSELETLVNKTYGSKEEAFVFVYVEDEAESGDSFNYGPFVKGNPVTYEILEYIPTLKDFDYIDWRKLLHLNKCPQFMMRDILQDLVNLGKLPEGELCITCI